MIIAGTGHRPNKLGGYDDGTFNSLTNLAMKFLKEHEDYDTVISGMALGWDMAFALGALLLKKKVIAAVPFKGQELKWPLISQERYNKILSATTEVKIISEGLYSPEKMQIRNEWMVDNADVILALWDGSTGGTANCIAYAKSKNKKIINLWDTYNGR